MKKKTITLLLMLVALFALPAAPNAQNVISVGPSISGLPDIINTNNQDTSILFGACINGGSIDAPIESIHLVVTFPEGGLKFPLSPASENLTSGTDDWEIVHASSDRFEIYNKTVISAGSYSRFTLIVTGFELGLKPILGVIVPGASTPAGTTVRPLTVRTALSVVDPSLPLDLVSFTATKQKSAAALHWTSATEQNCLGYTIQRSTDYHNWDSIGFVKTKSAGGTSSTALAYSFTDPAPVSGQNTYRLQQLYQDGQSAYSNTNTLVFGNTGTLKIYPNPVTDHLTLSGLAAGSLITVFDASGKTLYHTTASKTTLRIPVTSLSKGVYFVRITDQNGKTTQRKFVK